MNKLQTPFRYDYVCSFLRPAALKEARQKFEDGKIEYAELKAIEDQAIRELIQKIKELGYHVITDGEFRRATWHLDFMWGLDGVGHSKTQTGRPFHGEAAMIDDTYLTGKVTLTHEHPFIEHFRFVKSFEDENTVAKQTIPSPAQTLAQFTMPFNRAHTEKYYTNDQDLINDLVAAYSKFINDLYAAGCRNLQLDDCTWGMIADAKGHEAYGTTRAGRKAAVTGNQIRNAIGVSKLKSHAFTVTYDPSTDRLTFTAQGYGHGVGLSQIGAVGYANEAGWNYIQILSHYYSITSTTTYQLVAPRWGSIS